MFLVYVTLTRSIKNPSMCVLLIEGVCLRVSHTGRYKSLVFSTVTTNAHEMQAHVKTRSLQEIGFFQFIPAVNIKSHNPEQIPEKYPCSRLDVARLHSRDYPCG